MSTQIETFTRDGNKCEWNGHTLKVWFKGIDTPAWSTGAAGTKSQMIDHLYNACVKLKDKTYGNNQ